MRSALIVSGGGFQGLGLLEALQRISNVRPVVADVYADNVTRYLCADYIQVPPLTEREAFAEALAYLIEEYGILAVFPSTARELPLLAELSPGPTAGGVRFAVSSAALVDVLLDKLKTAAFLRDNGLPTQNPIDPRTHDFATPLFGKPRFGWGGTDTAIATSSEDTARYQDAAPDGGLVWFPLLPAFEEHSADFAVLESGLVSPVVLRKRIRTSGGYAVITESASNPGISALVKAVAARLAETGGKGIFNVQTLAADGVETFVSDINPRFGTSAVHGLAEGVNLAEFFIDGPVATMSASRPARREVKTVRYLKTLALPKLRRRPKGVVFDLDDTLVDHKLWMAAKIRGAYRTAASAWADETEFMLHALQLIDEGERARLIDRLAEHFGWEEERQDALLTAYRGVLVHPTPLYPDVHTVLADLHRSGYKLAVLTDNPPETQRAKIAQSQVSDLFSTIMFARDTGGEKPNTAAYSAVASSLSLPPGELCMVGDNYFRDALGAIRSGYSDAFVLARHGSFLQPHQEISRLIDRPDRIHHIESLIALREVLTSI